MNPALKFTLKVWFTSAALSPVIIALWQMVYHNISGDDIAILLFLILFGGIFSIPSAALLWLAAYLIPIKSGLNYPAQKTLLTIVGLSLTCLPFFIITGDLSLNNDIGYIIIIYAITIVAGIWVYPLRPADSDTLEIPIENQPDQDANTLI
ncbi:MAG: hypothetical protein V4592_04955 [Bacteroidota bacterium]